MNTELLGRLQREFEKVASCHCGNGVAEGGCDNHDTSWNPCPTSQLIYDASNELAALYAERDALAAVVEDLSIFAAVYAGIEERNAFPNQGGLDNCRNAVAEAHRLLNGECGCPFCVEHRAAALASKGKP